MFKVSVVLRPIMEVTDTKSKILKGAEELFMRYGIRSVSMDNISSHIGASKKTLYQYFKDKDEMVYSVAEAHITRDIADMNAVASKAKDAIEEIVMMSSCLRENLRNMNPSLLFDLQKYHHQAWNLWVDHKTNYIKKRIERSIDQGKLEGTFRPELNTEIIAIMRMETIQIAFDPALYPSEKFALADVQMQLFEHFIYGLFTEKGKKLYEKHKKKLIAKENSTQL
ncbi:MAG TPA: TetR/AcrR family transcriptional regulator [Cytophagales bacterium]|nr:TetR/AcrR family transcriptional regulator [Cytophagales bacterium]